jgi:uncharacterized membrane protein YphA (DoxX/SURF4 family)
MAKKLLTLQSILGLVYLLLGLASLFFLYFQSADIYTSSETGFTFIFQKTANPDESIVKGFKVLYHIIAWSLTILGIIIILADEGIYFATYVSRIVVGSLFVVSGLIKANDPIGFSYKLEEYFDEKALGSFWAMFHDYALPLAVIIAVTEVVLGLAILVGGKSRMVSFTLLAMTLFFAWLTFYTATCNNNQSIFQKQRSEQLKSLEKQYEAYYPYAYQELDSTYTDEDKRMIKEYETKRGQIENQSFDKVCVNDCGCFGDALKGSVGRSLTPWESFYKDVALLVFVLIIFIRQQKIQFNSWRDDIFILPATLIAIALFSGGLFNWWFPLLFAAICLVVYLFIKKIKVRFLGNEWAVATAFIIISLLFTLYCMRYLPVKDFRPYAIGKNINTERTDIQPKYQFFYKLKNKTSGEVKEFDAFPENYEADWEYIDMRQVTLDPGKPAPARDFSVADAFTGVEYTDSLLNLDYVILLISYDLKTACDKKINKIKMLAQEASANNIPFICLTASPVNIIQEKIKSWELNIPFAHTDEKVLKTMIRSNPGIMLLNKGWVLDKWPHPLIPPFNDVKLKYFK